MSQSTRPDGPAPDPAATMPLPAKVWADGLYQLEELAGRARCTHCSAIRTPDYTSGTPTCPECGWFPVADPRDRAAWRVLEYLRSLETPPTAVPAGHPAG